MALSRGNLSQLRTAYRSVFNVSDIDEQLLVRYGNEAISYASRYPFEDDELMSFRFTSISDISDKDGINEYLNKVPNEEFSGEQMSSYGRLFELAKKYKVLSATPTEEATPTRENNQVVEDFRDNPTVSDSAVEVEPINNGYNTGMEENHEFANPAASVDSVESMPTDTKNKIQNTFKEEHKMNAIEKLAQEANATGVGATVGTNVAEVSKNDRNAAKKLVEASQSDRMNYSKNAKIIKVLVTRIDREKKAVEGRAAMGYVSNPKKALETFIAKTGADSKDGTITFSKLHASQMYDDAKRMYELLQAAVADPQTKVEPYFGKPDAAVPISMKGVVIEDPDHQVITLPQKELAAHILQHAFLYLDVNSKSNAQFQLDAAKPRTGSAPKKSYVVKVANKSELLEDEAVCVFVKKITDKRSESKTGFKSALSVACNSGKMDANGEPKKITWRIPLEVEQYEVEVVEQYADLFKSGVGNSAKPMTISSSADIENIVDKISTLIAAEAAKSSSDSALGAELLGALNAEKSKIVAEDAAAVNATLGGASSEEDFEG